MPPAKPPPCSLACVHALPRQTPLRATFVGSGWMSVSPPMKSMPMLLTSRTTLFVTWKSVTLPFSVSASLRYGLAVVDVVAVDDEVRDRRRIGP
jgi:hypothetical protein